MPNQAISDLYAANPVIIINDDCMFEVAGDFGSGMVSGAVKLSTIKGAPATTGGAGTEASPYTGADNAGGINTSIATFTRGGAVNLGRSRYNVSAAAGVVISTPSITLHGESLGFNVDPNGEAEGISGAKLKQSGAVCVTIGSADKVGGALLRDFYIRGSDKANSSKAVSLSNRNDQTRLENLNISNVHYGIHIAGETDALHVSRCSMLNVGYGIYKTSASVAGYDKIDGCEISDNDNGGIFWDANGDANDRWIRIQDCTFARNARILTSDGCAIYLAVPESVIANSVIRASGNGVAADGIILAGDRCLVSGCQIVDNVNGAGIRVRGDGNVIMACKFDGNTTDIIVDNGADGTIIYCEDATTVTDNGQNTHIIRPGSVTGPGIPVQSIKAASAAVYGAFWEIDATSMAGGQKWRFGSTSNAAGEGGGKFLIIDQTGGQAARMVIDGLGNGILGDGGSTYGLWKSKTQTSVNATTGLTAGVLAALTTASIVIYDGSGQAYRVPCII